MMSSITFRSKAGMHNLFFTANCKTSYNCTKALPLVKVVFYEFMF